MFIYFILYYFIVYIIYSCFLKLQEVNQIVLKGILIETFKHPTDIA